MNGLWSSCGAELHPLQEAKNTVLVKSPIACLTLTHFNLFFFTTTLFYAYNRLHFRTTPSALVLQHNHTSNGRRQPNSTGPSAPKAWNPQNFERSNACIRHHNPANFHVYGSKGTNILPPMKELTQVNLANYYCCRNAPSKLLVLLAMTKPNNSYQQNDCWRRQAHSPRPWKRNWYIFPPIC